jgi:EpsI family protein
MLQRNVLLSLAMLFFTFLCVTGISNRGMPRVVATNLERMPMDIGGYSGKEDRFPQSVYDELGADLHLYRHYRNTTGSEIDLYIGYYGTAKGGRTGHNPYACFPSSGWAIVESYAVPVPAIPYQDDVKVNYIMTKKGDIHLIVLHWYQSEGVKVLDTGLKQNVQRLIGKILRNRNDGAFVRLSTEVKANEVSEAKERVFAFCQKILDLMPRYWPEEK